MSAALCKLFTATPLHDLTSLQLPITMKGGGKFLLPRNKSCFRHTHTQSKWQWCRWPAGLFLWDCTLLPWPQPCFFSDHTGSERRKYVPL